jgi:hypothetical protein
VNRRRLLPSCSRSTRFSSFRYSMTFCCSRLSQPASATSTTCQATWRHGCVCGVSEARGRNATAADVVWEASRARCGVIVGAWVGASQGRQYRRWPGFAAPRITAGLDVGWFSGCPHPGRPGRGNRSPLVSMDAVCAGPGDSWPARAGSLSDKSLARNR